MAVKFKEIVEYIRIKNKNVQLKLVSAHGKDGDFYVSIAPSIHVSGYGRTKEDANQSFEENLRVFCEDILELSVEERNIYLSNLNFHQEKYKNKNFSKSFVDKDGVLKLFSENEEVTTSMLETVM